MKTLKLFNAVIAKSSSAKPLINESGYIIQPEAIWAANRIVDFYEIVFSAKAVKIATKIPRASAKLKSPLTTL